MSEVLHKNGHRMSDVSCRVAGAVYVENTDRGIKQGKREAQPFSDGEVDEGGVCATVKKCRDGLIILRS